MSQFDDLFTPNTMLLLYSPLTCEWEQYYVDLKQRHMVVVYRVVGKPSRVEFASFSIEHHLDRVMLPLKRD